MHALPQGLLCRVIWRSPWAADCILQVMPLPTSLLCKQQPCNARGTALLCWPPFAGDAATNSSQ